MIPTEQSNVVHSSTLHENLEILVHQIIKSLEANELSNLKRDFHDKLRLAQSQPDNTELIEDLWDFFYDWCVFEKAIPDRLSDVTEAEKKAWAVLKEGNFRSLFSVSRANDSLLKIKDLFGKKSYVVPKSSPSDFIGISRGDIIECRLLPEDAEKPKQFYFIRRPSFHPTEIHSYVKRKVKEFRKSQDYGAFQSWLWLLVGMHLKHRFYPQMPIDKIYDDNSRI